MEIWSRPKRRRGVRWSGESGGNAGQRAVFVVGAGQGRCFARRAGWSRGAFGTRRSGRSFRARGTSGSVYTDRSFGSSLSALAPFTIKPVEAVFAPVSLFASLAFWTLRAFFAGGTLGAGVADRPWGSGRTHESELALRSE